MRSEVPKNVSNTQTEVAIKVNIKTGSTLPAQRRQWAAFWRKIGAEARKEAASD